MKQILAVLTAGAVAFQLALLPGAAAGIIESKTLPDVAARDAGGAPVRLRAYAGHVLVIDFWASWCPPCKASFPALDALAREFEPRGVVVLAVNVDERRQDADAFLSAHPHTMTVLFDPKGTVPPTFGVRGMPASFVVDKSGAIRFTHMGYSGNVAEQYRREITQLLLPDGEP